MEHGARRESTLTEPKTGRGAVAAQTPPAWQLGAESSIVEERSPTPPEEDFPKYKVERLLAEGAEGRVFVVTDRDLQRRVAMKVMRSETAHDARRLARF